MQTIRLRSHVGNDGVLKIQLPEAKDIDLDIVIVYQRAREVQKRKWSLEFLSTFGSWEGEPLVREQQGEQPERESFL
jgi:hypothetical protein